MTDNNNVRDEGAFIWAVLILVGGGLSVICNVVLGIALILMILKG